MLQIQLENAVASLLAKIGKKEDFSFQQLSGGANNKVFRLDIGSDHFLLKEYFQDPDDGRDRLEAEFSFCKFAWGMGMRYLPQPLACDHENHIAIYEFIEGKQLNPDDIKKEHIVSALNFYSELNKYKETTEAIKLPSASEACFSISSHLRCVNDRVERLKAIEVSSQTDNEAAIFIKNKLAKTCKEVMDRANKQAQKSGIKLDAEIARSDKRISPSDFGFHNALLPSSGSIRFIDFEYAGWDDPAKTVCDFFCQPKIPVSMEYYDTVIDTVFTGLKDRRLHAARAAVLFPVYKIKWCCILLNDFQAVGTRRRDFSMGFINKDKQKSEQLYKVKAALKNVL